MRGDCGDVIHIFELYLFPLAYYVGMYSLHFRMWLLFSKLPTHLYDSILWVSSSFSRKYSCKKMHYMPFIMLHEASFFYGLHSGEVTKL